jgi:hypothetical protein
LPVLISTLLLRSLVQGTVNQKDYLKFKTMLNQMFETDEIKQTIRAVYMEVELIENSTHEQLKKIIHSRKIKTKPKGKTVFFQDFIDKMPNLSDSDDIQNKK